MIGTPESFFNLLNENKIKIAKKVIYPDHYNYKISDIEYKKIADLNNYKIVTTEKDFKKLKNLSIKFTVADLYINKLNLFKKFIKKYMKIIKYFFQFIIIITLFIIFKIIGYKNASLFGSKLEAIWKINKI